MPKFIYTVGLPGSGKTTWAREQMAVDPNLRRVNRDDIRAMMLDHWTPKSEGLTRTIRNFAIQEAIGLGFNVISDDTNLSPKVVKELKDVATRLGASLESKSFLDVPLHVCISRDEKRQNPVGASVIRDMWIKHVKPTIEPQDQTLPPAIICDLDGTLSQLNGRNPYDASTCDQDGCNSQVRQALTNARFEDRKIIFVSGREEKFRTETERFLAFNIGWVSTPSYPMYSLYMRPTGDSRNDAIVKEEIYNREIKGKYNVELVLDDRDRVVDMWRGLGLECWQVAYGAF